MNRLPAVPAIGLALLTIFCAAVSFVSIPVTILAGLWFGLLIASKFCGLHKAVLWMLIASGLLLWMQVDKFPRRGDLDAVANRLPARVQMQVEVVGDADPRIGLTGEQEQTFIPVRAVSIRYRSNWEKLNDPVQIRIEGRYSDKIVRGSVWVFEGVLQKRRASWTGLRSATHVLQVRPRPHAALPGVQLRKSDLQWSIREMLSHRIKSVPFTRSEWNSSSIAARSTR